MVPLNNSQFFLTSLNRLIDSFRRLPGVGPKTAQRLAFYVLKMQDEDVKEFSDSLTDLKSQILYCNICQNISEKLTCEMCVDKTRDDSLVCVVEDPMDIYVIDKAGIYNGTFHVLHGSISPSRGIGPEELRIKQLLERIKKNINIKKNQYCKGGNGARNTGITLSRGDFIAFLDCCCWNAVRLAFVPGCRWVLITATHPQIRHPDGVVLSASRSWVTGLSPQPVFSAWSDSWPIVQNWG